MTALLFSPAQVAQAARALGGDLVLALLAAVNFFDDDDLQPPTGQAPVC